MMQFNTAIFDMDGLLIDSEPYWQEAGIETLQHFGVALTIEQYHYTTGLRTKEWIDYWFHYFSIDMRFAKDAETTIVDKAVEKINDRGTAMPGMKSILSFFRDNNFRMALATSSPMRLVDVVVEKLKIRSFFSAYASAENLAFSKPNPQVYIDAAAQLGANPLECICFEDSFNGMIAAKAARMTCVVVPPEGNGMIRPGGALPI